MFPAIFQGAFSLIHTVHRYLYWQAKLKRLLENHPRDYVPGTIAQFFFGGFDSTKTTAKLTEIALHTLRAAQSLKRLKNNVVASHHCIFTTEEGYSAVDWNDFKGRSLFPISLRIYAKELYLKTLYKIRGIADGALNTLKEAYRFSRDMMYAEFAFEGHPMQLVELGANLVDIQKEFSNEEMQETVESIKVFIGMSS